MGRRCGRFGRAVCGAAVVCFFGVCVWAELVGRHGLGAVPPLDEGAAEPRAEAAHARGRRAGYARRLDAHVAAACDNYTSAVRPEPAPGCAGPLVATYNVFRMFERGTAAMIGAWLAVQGYNYVALNELNGFNETGFRKWARGHGFRRAFLLETDSGYHVGFMSRRDASCVARARRVDGFAHGALHVECAAAHFIVTHLTPFDVASRRAEAQRLAGMVRAIRATKAEARVLVLGDLNSPPPLEPYASDLPVAVSRIEDADLKIRLVRKFFELPPTVSKRGIRGAVAAAAAAAAAAKSLAAADGAPPRLDSVVAARLRGAGLADTCASAGFDACGPSVPTTVGADDSHAVAVRLDFIYAGAKTCGPARVVRDALTDALSDHYPVEVVLDGVLAGAASSPPTDTAANARRLACDWAASFAADYASADLRRADARARHASRWRREASELQGARRAALWAPSHRSMRRPRALDAVARARRQVRPTRGFPTRGPDQVPNDSTGESCEHFCAGRQNATRNTTDVCLEEAIASKSFASCERMTAFFGCPFGCRAQRGPELPAYVEDSEADFAGVCLVPSDAPPPPNPPSRRAPAQGPEQLALARARARARTRPLSERLTAAARGGAPVPRNASTQVPPRWDDYDGVAEARRRLLALAAKSIRERLRKQAASKELKVLGLDVDNRRQRSACEAWFPSTQRLCACIVVETVVGEPRESCAAACARRRKTCDDGVLRSFNRRGCDGRGASYLAVRSAGAAHGNEAALPAVRRGGGACFVASAKALAGLSCAAAPADPTLARICPCLAENAKRRRR
ncbi:hypothetical protein M885DRAFT_149460 [Pelagophyceae sp. CCMP2097]|nr:hypothetical protein M885DRAFT_149460 [Pelagophyceae sp. CCMP2097]